MRFFFLFGILILNIAAFAAQSSSDHNDLEAIYPASPETRYSSVRIIAHGATRFSNQFVQEVAKNDRRNLVTSSLGVFLTLSMASVGARNSTELLLLDILGLPSDSNSRNVGFQTIIDRLNSYKAVELHIANGAFVSSEIRLNPEFIETTTKVFRSPVQKVDFNDSLAASNLINEWCENKTQGHIESIVNPDDLSETTGLVLVNAVYFKGAWLKKFDVADTMETPFILEDGTIKQVLSMNAVHVLRYGSIPEVDANFIELPYQSESGTHKMSMFILLPEELDGLAYLEAHFHEISIKNLLKRGTYRRVNVQLPKFRIESEFQLREPLTRMNMSNLFDPYRADFTGIVESPRLVLDKIVQKAFIEINEEGSEAAAATAAVFGARMNRGQRYVDFIVDHPFYAIIATTDEIPLNIFTVRFTG